MTRTRLAALALGLAGFTAAIRLGLDREASQMGRVRDPAWLPNGARLRQVSLGHRLLLADVFWLKLVQYMGESVMLKLDRWEALYPLADLVTDLDPRYGYAYQVAGSNLASFAHRYGEADRILRKGMKNVPQRWTLPWTLSVNKFLFEGDYATAARYARQAAEVGGRPHLALLASNLSLLADRDDEYHVAIGFLEETLRHTDDPNLRPQLEQRLVKVRTFLELSRLERALAEFERTHARRAVFLGELVAAGLLGEVPRDPSGGTFLYNAITGEVRSSLVGRRTPLRPERNP
jgi:tetratricopeptide (TPR) repeat protein